MICYGLSFPKSSFREEVCPRTEIVEKKKQKKQNEKKPVPNLG